MGRPRQNPWRDWRFLAVLAATIGLGVLVRGIAIAVIGPSRVEFGDAQSYLDAAIGLCTTGTYPEHSNLPFFRAPGLPFFLAGVTICHPTTVWIGKLALALSCGVTMLAAASIASSFVGGFRAPILAALGIALWPFFIMATTDLRTEPLFQALLTSGLALFFMRPGPGQMPRLLAAGVLLGLSALVRPAGLVAVPFCALAYLCRIAPASVRAGFLGATLILCGAFVALSPWVARNYLRFGDIILVNDAGPYALWRASHPIVLDIYREPDPETFRRRMGHFEGKKSKEIALEIAREATSPGERRDLWRQRFLERVAASPGAHARIYAKQAAMFWRLRLDEREYAATVIATGFVLFLALWTMATIGWFSLWRRNPPIATTILAWFLFVTLAQSPFENRIRYREPLVSPLLIVLAAVALGSGGIRKPARSPTGRPSIREGPLRRKEPV